jgi:hypothetical protein
MRLVWLFYGLAYVALLAGWFRALTQLRQFLGAVTAIGDEAMLQGYKALVRSQMYLALFGIACMLAGLLLGMFLILARGLKGLAVVLLTNVVVLLLGLYLKRVEERARSLVVIPALADEYRRVSQAWLQKPLPDF